MEELIREPSGYGSHAETHPNWSDIDGLPLDGHVGSGEYLLNRSRYLWTDAIAGDHSDLLAGSE